MWSYEYTLEGLRYRFSADTFEACLTALIQIRARSPHLTDVEIFEGGTEEFDTGIKLWGSHELVS